MNQDTQISMPLFKASASVATAVGAQIIDASSQASAMFADLLVLTWPNIAAGAAALLSLSYLGEWWWKKFWRPLFERWGWIKPRPRHPFNARELARLLAQQESDQAPLS